MYNDEAISEEARKLAAQIKVNGDKLSSARQKQEYTDDLVRFLEREEQSLKSKLVELFAN